MRSVKDIAPLSLEHVSADLEARLHPEYWGPIEDVASIRRGYLRPTHTLAEGTVINDLKENPKSVAERVLLPGDVFDAAEQHPGTLALYRTEWLKTVGGFSLSLWMNRVKNIGNGVPIPEPPTSTVFRDLDSDEIYRTISSGRAALQYGTSVQFGYIARGRRPRTRAIVSVPAVNVFFESDGTPIYVKDDNLPIRPERPIFKIGQSYQSFERRTNTETVWRINALDLLYTPRGRVNSNGSNGAGRVRQRNAVASGSKR